MTAQIGILNANGVALATDSAMSVDFLADSRYSRDEDKLFALENCHAIAVMVSGAGDYMGVPWKTLVKLFSETLEQDKLDSFEAYFERFIDFLSKDVSRYIPDSELECWKKHLRVFISQVVEKYTVDLKEMREIAGFDLASYIRNCLNEELKHWQNAEPPKGFSRKFKQQVREEFEPFLIELIENSYDVFHEPDRKLLVEIGIEFLLHGNSSQSPVAELVVAGFGKSDALPQMASIRIEPILMGKTKFFAQNRYAIQKGDNVIIQMFGQDHGLRSFTDGVDPEFLKEIMGVFNKGYSEFIYLLNERMTFLSDKQRKKMTKIVDELAIDSVRGIESEIREKSKEDYIDPMLGAIAFLSANELAKTAHAFVNIVALQSSVSLRYDPSVADPIDCAVITRSEGFRWVKYKNAKLGY